MKARFFPSRGGSLPGSASVQVCFLPYAALDSLVSARLPAVWRARLLILPLSLIPANEFAAPGGHEIFSSAATFRLIAADGLFSRVERVLAYALPLSSRHQVPNPRQATAIATAAARELGHVSVFRTKLALALDAFGCPNCAIEWEVGNSFPLQLSLPSPKGELNSTMGAEQGSLVTDVPASAESIISGASRTMVPVFSSIYAFD
jgi:hypothetical protein